MLPETEADAASHSPNERFDRATQSHIVIRGYANRHGFDHLSGVVVCGRSGSFRPPRQGELRLSGRRIRPAALMALRQARQKIARGSLSDASQEHSQPCWRFTTGREEATTVQGRGNGRQNCAEAPNRAKGCPLQQADERTGSEWNAWGDSSEVQDRRCRGKERGKPSEIQNERRP